MQTKEQADGDEGDGKPVWDNMMKGIDEKDGDHHRAKNCVFVKKDAFQPVFVKKPDEQGRGDDFHDQVMPVKLCSAFAAFAFEVDIAEDGNIQVKGDFIAAICASGARPDDGLMLRKAMDQHIKKAAQGGAQDSQKDYDNCRQNISPSSGSCSFIPGLFHCPERCSLLIAKFQLDAVCGAVIHGKTGDDTAAVVVIKLEGW